MKTAISEFLAVAHDPWRWVAEWKKITGRRVIAYVPMYVPEELIDAAGMLPVALQGSDAIIGPAHDFVHPYLCHPIRSNLDLALLGTMDAADGMVTPSTCDQAKRVGSLWRIVHPMPFFHSLSLPRILDVPGSKEYYLQELVRFKRELETFGGAQISEAALRQSITVFNETRGLLGQLWKLRIEAPQEVPASEVAAIMAAAMTMPKSDFNPLLSQYLQARREIVGKAGDGVRLFLAGNPCEDVESGFFELLDELGAYVVGDDLYCGEKYLTGTVPNGGVALEALADAYFSGIGCPTKHDGGKRWADHVVRRSKQTAAAGVVVMMPKFCEIYAFDYPGLKHDLERADIPHLMLESDHSGMAGQAKTRLQAFVEMMRGE